MAYVKDTPRINVKFINADTEVQLFEIKDRSWMNIGEIFTDGIASTLIETHCKDKGIKQPENIMILAVVELKLQ